MRVTMGNDWKKRKGVGWREGVVGEKAMNG